MKFAMKILLLTTLLACQAAFAATAPPPKYNVSYGDNPQQTMDVYCAAKPNGAAMMMVHGGGWLHGDKANAGVIQHKLETFGAEGWTVLSINYPLPEPLADGTTRTTMGVDDPVSQARSLAQAIAFAQKRARFCHFDADKLGLVGHSAGAHLVTLVTADPSFLNNAGAKPTAFTVSLDSAALNLVPIMAKPHDSLYDVFDHGDAYIQAASPYQHLSRTSTKAPIMLVYSSDRGPGDERQTTQFATQAQSLGIKVTVQAEALSHADIDDQLGVPGAYTTDVDKFMRKAVGL